MVLEAHAMKLVVGRPWKGRDVGDGVIRAAEIRVLAESVFEQLVKPLHLRLIAAHRVIIAGRREVLEMRELSEHWADASQLDHQPLNDFIARRNLLRQQATGLVGEIHEDRARLDYSKGTSPGPLVVNNDRDLAVGIHLAKIG